MVVNRPHEPIAIIGIGCAFPGARGPDAFWRLLREGREGIREIPPDRFDVDQYYDPVAGVPGKIITRRAGFIEDIDKFDPGFFAISPREAESMDPQQRLLLEVTWEALEDAGLVPEELRNSATGVFIGSSSSDYADLQLRLGDSSSMDAYTLPGTARSMLAGRISRTLNLKGPSIATDTACSSSMVALHLACQSLWQGESTLALAGGVNVILTPEPFVVLSLPRILSPEGRSKVFDAQANGFVRGEGAGIVVLKPLAQAQDDNDSIYAVIHSSAMNNDGHSSSVLAPNQQAQEAVLRQAYRLAGISPRQIQYVEAHGTGTTIGDRIEAEALGAVMAEGHSQENPCIIGSVKTNIGHLEGGAGIAGLIKTALCLEHRAIPASLHVELPTPAVAWDQVPLVIQREYRQWPATEGRAYAGVSSFGISGTNVHAVLSAPAPQSPPPTQKGMGARPPYLLPLSAHSSDALGATVAQFHDFLRDEGNGHALHDLCYCASLRRSHYAHRLAFVANSQQELVEQLASYQNSTFKPPVQPPQAPIFVFSGQGSKFWPLDANLLTRLPIFRQMLERCDALLAAHASISGEPWSLLEQLTAADHESRMNETDISQAAIFSCQVALAEQWRQWGIEPSAIIGHSLGEVAAAYVAGALTLEEAIHVVTQRGRITKRAAGQGAMALVGLSRAEAMLAIQGYTTTLTVAVSNSPTNCVLSGDPAALVEVMDKLQRQNVFVRSLSAIDYAAHSPQMETLKDELAHVLATLAPQNTTIPFYSTVTAALIEGKELHAGYWAANLRESVRFDETVQRALADGHHLFLEVHPHQVLVRPMQEIIAHSGQTATVLPSLQREVDGPTMLMRSLSHLYRHGCSIRWESLYPSRGKHLRLPHVCWQRGRYWIASDTVARPRISNLKLGTMRHPLLDLGLQLAVRPSVRIYQMELSANQPSYLGDHRLQSTPILPAAAYVEMALAVAQDFGRVGRGTVGEMSFEKALFLPEQDFVTIQLVMTESHGTYDLEFFSRAGEGDLAPWVLHSRGKLWSHPLESGQVLRQGPSPRHFQTKAESTVAATDFYARMSAHGLNYGTQFQTVAKLWQKGWEVLTEFVPSRLTPAENSRYQIHPTLLDGAFQSVAALLHTTEVGQVEGTFLPVAMKALHLYQPSSLPCYVHAIIQPFDPTKDNQLRADLYLLDLQGHILAEVEGFVLQRVTSGRGATPFDLDRYLYRVEWQQQVVAMSNFSSASTHVGRWLIYVDQGGLGDAVAQKLRAIGHECVVMRDDEDMEEDEQVREGDATAIDHPTAMLQRIVADFPSHKPITGILYCVGLDATSSCLSDIDSLSPHPTLLRLLYLVQALAKMEGASPPRLWIVTRNCQLLAGDDELALLQTPLWGLAGTIASEFPRLRCSSVDLGSKPQTSEVDDLVTELLADGREDRIAYRQNVRWVARLDRYTAQIGNITHAAGADEPFRLEIPRVGILENFTFRTADRLPPEPDEVEIQVQSAGLNFLDVLSALGLRPDQEGNAVVLGMECAGRVTRIGSGVTHVRVGERVLALAPHSFASFTRTRANLAFPIPVGISYNEAATLPIAYLTAYYALHTLGRLRSGERVLIHAAAGGVGLAAVYLAQHFGAEIFATAGTPEKRAFLQQLGVAHVMDSRTLNFADEVLTATQGEGVDLVLNSLAGEAIPKSLAILRANGRFLEIGKRDIYGHSLLNMGLLKKNIAFFAIDLLPLIAEQSVECGELLGKLVSMVEDGTLPTLPFRAFAMSEAEQAFRYMAQAKHTGKIVIEAHDSRNAVLPIQSAPKSTIQHEVTYLITGGLGGLGIAVARWLVEQGARHLVLVGRGKPSAEVQATIVELMAQGAELVIYQADVTQETEMCALFQHIDATMPRLGGVFHAAGVLDDGVLLQMSARRFQRVMAPKVRGGWLLHQLTLGRQLDFFILFSSAASILGAPGQGNYVAANAFLEGLAHYRHTFGLPALAINWGTWAKIGMASQHNRAERMAQVGILPLEPQQGVNLLGRMLATSAAQLAAIAIDWPRLLQRSQSPLFDAMRISDGAGDDAATHTSSLRERLLSLSPAERAEIVSVLLQEQIAQVLHLPASRFDSNQPLSYLGIDSLMAVELVNRVEVAFGLRLPLESLHQSPTIVKLTQMILSLLEGGSLEGQQVLAAALTTESTPDERFAISVSDLAREASLAPALVIATRQHTRRAVPKHVFLTGATGFLGAFLLHDLLLESEATLHCLVRAKDAASGRQRVLDALARRFPGEAIEAERIVALSGDLAQPNFGLADAEFANLAEATDLIIHNGASVNWLAPYEQLKPTNVQGTQTMIRLAAGASSQAPSSQAPTPLHYVSSLGVFPMVGNHGASVLDEETPLDYEGLLYGGYSQSKWAAEKLMRLAAAQGLPVSIYRPSFIIGHSGTGLWQGNDIIVRMMQSWIELGAAPDLDARLDLVPVDFVSRAIVQLALRTEGGSGATYHLNNSHSATVNEIVQWLNRAGYAIASIPYPTWRRQMLKRRDVSPQTLLYSIGPLLALQVSEEIEWLHYIPIFGNEFTRQQLRDLTCPPLSGERFQGYIEYFQRSGVFPAVAEVQPTWG